ncbi:MFS transporter [Saccharopolyspora sp. 5N708]|uniref:MFS transporter n=1 Tax=Saccharopolyspora sp. 5N708 TaxID=3457424 RepID=UPI003FD53A17
MYRAVVARRGFTRWAIVASSARSALAMMPLGLVLLGVNAAGTPVRGAVLAGVFTAAELLAAPLVASRLPLQLGLAGMSLGSAVLAVGAALAAPVAVLSFAAAATGFLGAGLPGQVRAALTALVPDSARAAAYSLESTASAALYVVGPAVVATLFAVAGWVAFAFAALVLAIGAAVALTWSRPAADKRHRLWHGDRGAFARIWPTCAAAAAFMGAVASLDVAVPALLAERGTPPATAGYLLAAFAATGIVGGLVYGARRWPGTAAAQACLSALAMCAVLALLGLPEDTVAVAFLLLAAGLFGPPSLVARSLAVQQRLSPDDLGVGFSLLSAAAGLGASLAAFSMAALIAVTSPGTALLTVLAATSAVTVLALLAERRCEAKGITNAPLQPSTPDSGC